MKRLSQLDQEADENIWVGVISKRLYVDVADRATGGAHLLCHSQEQHGLADAASTDDKVVAIRRHLLNQTHPRWPERLSGVLGCPGASFEQRH